MDLGDIPDVEGAGESLLKDPDSRFLDFTDPPDFESGDFLDGKVQAAVPGEE